MPLQVIAGRYHVERSVGQGSMGTVWLCRDDVLHRPVAVKQIGILPGDTADHARRAMREARTAAALNHKNAVSIYDVVEHENAPWLVMEYVPSQTLAEVMEDGQLSAPRVAWIGAQVAAALASAHALGIIHRDVKPGNILIGEDDLAKISDFGIARMAHDEQLTQTGMMTGTPAYFSPELARGGEPGPESDVWALGATLYAAVEGRAPYGRRANPIATLQAITSEEVDHPRQADFLLGPIGHMMDRDPSSRWTMARAETLLRELVERPDSTPVTGAVPGPAPPAGPPTAPPTAPPAAPPPATGRSKALPVALALAALLVLGIGGYFLFTAQNSDEPSANRSPAAGNGSAKASPSESATEDSPADPEAAQVEAVESYFEAVPSDLDAGWAMLSPSMQQRVGRDSYDGFWSTIEAVQVADVQPLGGNAVSAQVTYTGTDGSVSEEQQQIALVADGAGYLIDSDR
ncbi:MAG TPA: serine/threonine-protein kinase [Nocardioidaceae bacterium]|nr:serine/threonine-protein kinase [Nocardioidaceae bacterium]